MFSKKQCPNCGQFKTEPRSVLIYLALAILVCAVLVITLPFEIILIPAAIVSLFIPAARRTHLVCRNCKWTDKVATKPQAATTA